MITTLAALRTLLAEALSSKLGAKNRDVFVHAGSKLADEIEPELTDMVKSSYASIGGNPKINKVGDLSSEYPDWVVADTDDDPDVDVFIAGRSTLAGEKMAVMATDGSSIAKTHLLQMQRNLYHDGWWAEVSGAPAHIALNKLHIKSVEEEAKVRALLGKEITWFGEHPEGKFPGTYGWYARDIGGHQHAKIIVGDV